MKSTADTLPCSQQQGATWPKAERTFSFYWPVTFKESPSRLLRRCSRGNPIVLHSKRSCLQWAGTQGLLISHQLGLKGVCEEYMQDGFSGPPNPPPTPHLCLHCPQSQSLLRALGFSPVNAEQRRRHKVQSEHRRGLGNQMQLLRALTQPLTWDTKIRNAKNVHKTLKFHLHPQVIIDLGRN